MIDTILRYLIVSDPIVLEAILRYLIVSDPIVLASEPLAFRPTALPRYRATGNKPRETKYEPYNNCERHDVFG
jgi:hypothetical protein